jgi:hypothetical protein
MNRRRFLQGTLAGAAVAGPARLAAEGRTSPPDRPTKKGLLKAGHQHRSADADLRLLAALGVNHICSALPSRTLDANWSVEGLTRLRERVECASTPSCPPR